MKATWIIETRQELMVVKLRVLVSCRSGKQIARLELDGKVVARVAGDELELVDPAEEDVPDDCDAARARPVPRSQRVPAGHDLRGGHEAPLVHLPRPQGL